MKIKVGKHKPIRLCPDDWAEFIHGVDTETAEKIFDLDWDED